MNTRIPHPVIAYTALFGLLLGLYLIGYVPEFHSSDGRAMFSTAESLVRHGAWDIEQIRWMDLQQGTYGLDGLLYSRKGLGQPLLALPLTWLGLVLPGVGPVGATLLFGSLLTAGTAVLLAHYLHRLGFSLKIGLLAGLVFGSGTLALPYAKTFFSDTLAGTLLLLAAVGLLHFKQSGRSGFAALAGLALGWAVATRYAEAVFLPVFGLGLLAYIYTGLPENHKTNRQAFIRAAWKPVIAFAFPIAIIGISLLTFNGLRYGDPLNTGYLPEESFSAIWWEGIIGQLLSPGRGLLLYSPILWLTFWGVFPFWRRYRLESGFALSVILIHLLLYGKWFMWHGGFAWGPRFMIATLPFWVILLAPTIKTMWAKRRRRFLFLGLWLASFIVQIPGVAVDFDLWQNQILNSGLPLFDRITFFSPAFSPLWHTWSLINMPNLDVAWMVEGEIVFWLLGLLLANLMLNGWGWWSMWRGRGGQWPVWVGLAGNGLLIAVLLTHVHRSISHPDAAPFATINRLPAAALSYHLPTDATLVAEQFAGRQRVLGATQADPAALQTLTHAQALIWRLTPYPTDIDTALQTDFGIAHRETFAERTLILYARPLSQAQQFDVPFDEGITLQTASVTESFSPGAPLAITFHWQARHTPSQNYRVFLHLRNANGETVAQTDGEPAHWQRPTTTWQPGETIADPHALTVPVDLPRGAYRLVGGWYQPDHGTRLVSATGLEEIVLGEWDWE